jgi:hypothetical protein
VNQIVMATAVQAMAETKKFTGLGKNERNKSGFSSASGLRHVTDRNGREQGIGAALPRCNPGILGLSAAR